MPRVLQILRGLAASKPTLQDGEMYLERDTSVLVIQNQSTEIRLARSSDIDSLQSNITTISGNVATLNQDVSSLETTVTGKMDKVNGTQGQFLGFTADNVIGAVDAPQPSASPYNSSSTFTLPASGWTSSGGRYSYAVNLAGMTSTQNPIVFPNWSSNRDAEQAAWNRLDGSPVSSNGALTFWADAQPGVAISCTVYYTTLDASTISLNNNIATPPTQTLGTFNPL